MHQNVFEKVRIRVAASLAPLCISLPGGFKRRNQVPESGVGEREINCSTNPVNPASSINQGGIKICKYLVQGDAVATDYVSNLGGPSGGNFSLMPIFFGNVWSAAIPGISQVMDAVNRIVNSPYLSQMDQYV